MFWWRHVFINSDYLFNNWLSFSAFIMNTFSVKHNLLKSIFVSENNFATTFHVTVGAIFASFSCYTYFENSVLFRYFLWANSFLWFLERSLKGVSETPWGLYIYIYKHINIYIYIYIYIKNNKVTQNRFSLMMFFKYKPYKYVQSKGCRFVLLIWRCLGIRYQADVKLRTATVGGFARFEFIYEIVLIRFS